MVYLIHLLYLKYSHKKEAPYREATNCNNISSERGFHVRLSLMDCLIALHVMDISNYVACLWISLLIRLADKVFRSILCFLFCFFPLKTSDDTFLMFSISIQDQHLCSWSTHLVLSLLGIFKCCMCLLNCIFTQHVQKLFYTMIKLIFISSRENT